MEFLRIKPVGSGYPLPTSLKKIIGWISIIFTEINFFDGSPPGFGQISNSLNSNLIQIWINYNPTQIQSLQMVPLSFGQFPASPRSNIIISCISIANTQNYPFEIPPIASRYILAPPKGKIIISCIKTMLYPNPSEFYSWPCPEVIVSTKCDRSKDTHLHQYTPYSIL